MLMLSGRDSLSPFRRERLQSRLDQVAPGLRLRSADQFYFLDSESSVGLDGTALARLLSADPKAPEESADAVLVVPRFGTLSPWSSKAREILRGAGFPVRRIEQGQRLLITGLAGLTAAVRAAALRTLHDPMTQSLAFRLEELAQSFQQSDPAPLQRIELGAAPLQSLQQANSALGLALSSDEIEYLASSYAELGRDPSDAELMMFAQANSEHCRHKVFNASWTVDGVDQPVSLFQMIKNTHAVSPQGTLSAYRDNAAVVANVEVARFYAEPGVRQWRAHDEPVAFAIKCETHNHPTAISPFAGASTGSGGEIRDEGATGRGAKPKAGLSGFTVSALRIPGLPRPWETERPLPPRMASAFEIMRDGPLGAAAFNNEFGRPALCGYFRSFEYAEADAIRGYDKPIMLAGGLGNLHPDHVEKQRLSEGDAIIVLGGPAMLIGLGGGAASSLASGQSSEELDFASVQRDNPEMERRCQEVLDRCWSLGARNPLVSLHDVGAGGLSNAIPELLHDSEVGGSIELREIPCDEPGMSPMQIWCNESQERYVMGVRPDRLAEFAAICERERCPYAVVGTARSEQRLLLSDRLLRNHPIDLPMSVLFGKAPKMHRDARRVARSAVALNVDADVDQALQRVLRHPTVGSKSFLITIGDRSVGGLCARDQFVGPLQVPVADCAVTLCDFSGYTGEAMALGERTPLALLDPAASARMAVAEALTNIAAAPIASRSDIKLSANWMAAVNQAGEDAALFDAVHAVGMEFCPALGLGIPVGKDSLSMQATWRDGAGDHRVSSPVSLIVTAFARVTDARRALTPELRLDAGPSTLLLIDLPRGRHRLGGSTLAQCFGQIADAAPDVDSATDLAALFDAIQLLAAEDKLLAYHDRSDGGALVSLLEMAFAGNCGLQITLDGWAEDRLAALFNEEIGVVVQVRADDLKRVHAVLADAGLADCVHAIAVPLADEAQVRLRWRDDNVFSWSLSELRAAWHETSHAMQRLRDNPACADQEQVAVTTSLEHALRPLIGFDAGIDIAAPFILSGVRPKIAILREQGVNGQVEMAAAFDRAGFDAFDVHMSDLIAGDERLKRFDGLVACGGFSYGDVLGAGRGWAASIRHHGDLAAQFGAFFSDRRKFVLGVCNGCQMISQLRDMIPGAAHWPQFRRNQSEQFEARLSLVEILPSPSILFNGMAGSRIPVVVSHGEGRVEFSASSDAAMVHAALRFVDADGKPAARYPGNPNGSPGGLTGFTTEDGRATILMPHPERVHRSVQMSWRPREWGESSPWMRMFRNARAWLA